EHYSSLLLPHNGILVETALSDWLGITYGYEEVPDDLINLETYMSDMNINGNKEQEDEVEKEEKVDENEQDETNDCSKEEK
ncbi:unnamed protein product, partial [Rotaria magnacalcarata]